MFLPVNDVCGRIIESPAPILFVDTCVFLDILRSPYREDIDTNGIMAAMKLSAMSESNPKKVWLLTNETVHGEWNDNIDAIKVELEREVKKLETRRERVLAAAKLAFGYSHEHGQRILSLNIHSYLEKLSRTFLGRCLVTRIEGDHSIKAMQRVRNCWAPARKGKQEAKDCEIFESFLDISRKLRSSGYNGRICFVTSNSEDYGKPRCSPIQGELDGVSATYVNDLPWALAVVEGCAERGAGASDCR